MSVVDKGRILFDLTDFGLGGEFGLHKDSFQTSIGRSIIMSGSVIRSESDLLKSR